MPDQSNVKPSRLEAATADCNRVSAQLGAFVEVLAVPLTTGATGPLSGMAIAIKDMVDVESRAPSLGLLAPPRSPPVANATVIDQLLAGGGAIVAFTEMTPLAFEPSGANEMRGRPGNPWSPDYICGGSSSGSAVAVATGCVDIALGSDTAGSLRIPAHCCGITAWKPTHGLIASDGCMNLAPSFDTIGFLARSAATLYPVAKVFGDHEASGAIKTIGVAHDVVALCTADIQRSITVTRTALDSLGLRLREIELTSALDAIDRDLFTVLQAEAAASNADLIAAGVINSPLQKRLEKGQEITAHDYERARRSLDREAQTITDRLFANCDAILVPVMATATPLVVECDPSSKRFSGRTLYSLSKLTRFVNALGLPAIAIPCGFEHAGLPIGLQIIGRHRSDLALLMCAQGVQSVTHWHTHVAPFDGSTGLEV